MLSEIKKYNAAQSAANQKICQKLCSVICKVLGDKECKVWHGSPVWFLDSNPIVGYAVRKDHVQLLFWSGQSFDDLDLQIEGKFKAAQHKVQDAKNIDAAQITRWLKLAKKIQWDYKNIAKRKGELVKLGEW